MNENGMDKSMSYDRTPMNFIQRTKKLMRKANRCTKNKSVQKHTSLKRDGVEMRNRPQRITRYPKEKVGSLRNSADVIRGLEPHWIEDPVMYDITSSKGGDSS